MKQTRADDGTITISAMSDTVFEEARAILDPDGTAQIVGLFYRRIIGLRGLLQPLYFSVMSAYAEAMELTDRQAVFEANREADEEPSPEFAQLMDETAALISQARDGSNAIVMICDSALRSLHVNLKKSITESGEEAYNGVKLSRAIWDLANRYRHVARWRSASGKTKGSESNTFGSLGIDLVDELSTIKFLEKCGFKSYRDFEDRLLSIATPFIPTGLQVSARAAFHSISKSFSQ